MIIKTAAKKATRVLSKIEHKLGLDSRFFGPPRGVRSSDELAQDTTNKVKVHRVNKSGLIDRSLPNTLEPEIHHKFFRDLQRELPSCYIVELEQGRIVGAQGVTISSSDYIVGDISRVISAEPYSFRELYQLRLPCVTKVRGRVGVVAGSGGQGYFHWLYDVFPKLHLLKKSAKQWDRLIIGYHETRFVQECLSYYGVAKGTILPATQYTHYEADVLLAPSLPGLPGNPPSWVIDFLRDVLLKDESYATPSVTSRKIYISRKDANYRHVSNEPAVEQYLKTHGFQTVVLSALTLGQQIEVFKNAEIIVAPHGAGLSNIAFCNSGAVLIELFAPQYVNVCYWSISNLLSMRYWYILGEDGATENYGKGDFQHSFSVSLEKLSAVINYVLS